MVLLGLVLGILFAVLVAMQGCGQHHPRKRPAPAPAVIYAP
jgi:hypothetical protein